MKNLYKALFLLLFAAFSLVNAKVKLPSLVSDGMVLQRDQKVKIWGMADAAEKVEVKFQNKKYHTVADNFGNWKIILPEMKAGGPFTMAINDIILNDILIGDVWLTSGQSNMELPVRRVMDLYADEINSYKNSMIHYLHTPVSSNYHHPESDNPKKMEWKTLNPENALSFSAVSYFFAKDLYEKTKIPIGIICSAVGGSPIESWISEKGLKEFPQYIHDRDLHLNEDFVMKANQLENEKRSIWTKILFREDKGVNFPMKRYDPDFNDRSWKTTDLDQKNWAKDGNVLINGSFWFRKDFELRNDQTGRDAVLRLGCVVDADSVFVNGTFVGTTSYQYPPRIYTVPKNILKAGKNNITVRLISYSGMAQFVDEKPYKLITGNGEIDLRKNWKYELGVRMPSYQAIPSTAQKATGFYNGMIAPLENVSLKGFLWYQGETNAGRSSEYGALLESLIKDWRAFFHQPDAPFLIVQLTSFMKRSAFPQESGWAELREQQRKASQTIPNTGLAVTIDVGEWNDIHPLNKKDVGKRLSLQAQKILFDKNIIADGPVYQSMSIEGNRIILSFKPGTDSFSPVSELKGFAVKGKDGIFKWAKAKEEGNKIMVWNDEVEDPVAVRYAWADNPDKANLKNKIGLPASPFTTE